MKNFLINVAAILFIGAMAFAVLCFVGLIVGFARFGGSVGVGPLEAVALTIPCDEADLLRRSIDFHETRVAGIQGEIQVLKLRLEILAKRGAK